MSALKKVPPSIRWISVIMITLLLLMTVYRLVFFKVYSAPGRGISGSALLLGLRYDARVVSILGLCIFFLTRLPFLNPIRNTSARKGWTIVLSVVALVFLLTYIADYFHFDYLRQRFSASVLGFLPDAAISFGMVWETYPVITILTGVVVFFILCLWLNKKLLLQISNAASPKRWISRAYQVSFVLILGLLIFGRLGQYPLRWSDAFSLGDDFKGQAALNPFQSFFSTLKFRNTSYDVVAVKKAYPLMADFLNVDQPDSSSLNFKRYVQFPATNAAPPNVVIVICESFHAAKSSMFGNPLDPTPFFNQVCKQGIFYERCFTPAFGTARGVWATITGVPDVEAVTTASRNPLAVNQHTIINDFKGYEKLYFLGGSTSWANIRGLLTNNIDGLQIIEEDNYDAATVDVWGISDKELFLAANKKLSGIKKPFFAIIQTADNHRPYTIPESDKKEFKLVSYPKDTLSKYTFSGNDELNAFRYSDFAFETFLTAAQKQAYFSNTIFIFVGDHGLRGGSGDLFPESFSREGFGAEHVPLLFYAPAILPPARLSTVCSQLDILPSAAYLAKQSFMNQAMGRNLFDSSTTRMPYTFIADPDTRFIGVVSDKYYFGRNLGTYKTVFVSVTDNAPVQDNAQTLQEKNYMSNLTNACYETARYMLLNNKKQ